MRFWDSSAVVPLLLQEASSRRLQTLLAEDHDMSVWWGTRIECTAAIARRERDETLGPEMVNRALQLLDEFVDGWTEIQPGDWVRHVAQRLLRVHALRASDALQLAAALAGTDRHAPLNEMVCLDQRLALAAQREGLRVIA